MDQLENNLNRVHEWIRSVDQKVSIFLAFQGVIITLLTPDLISIFTIDTCNSIVKIFLGIAGLMILLFSCYKSIMVIIPKISKGNSFTFFGAIANMTSDKYKNTIKKATGEDYENEFINQIYISSKIANSKHILFREAIFSFVIGVFLIGIYFII